MVDQNGVMHQDGVLILHHPNGQNVEFHDRGSAPPDSVEWPKKNPGGSFSPENEASSGIKPLPTIKGQAKQAKHAVSDCFKRCAVHAGVGRYLYELTGVQGGFIPKGALEKSLAAVGYHGPWDDRHHGKLGGIREADLEDEPEDAGLPQSPPSAPSPRTEAAEPLRAETGGGNSNGTDRAEAPAPEPAPKASGGGPKTARRASSVKISEEQRAQIEAAVEQGGGSLQSATFLGWLAKNTANHATSIDEVLSEDVDELVSKLEQLAAKRNRAGK
jgi:hypothetical protein